MHYKYILLTISAAFFTQQTVAAESKSLLTGSESSYCQKKGMRESKEFNYYVSCMQSEEKKSTSELNGTFNKALSNIQSEDWLLPNVDYQNENSKVVDKNRTDLQNDQNQWLKHQSEFCNVLTSRISNSAQMYPILEMQCHINMNKQRIIDLNYLLNNN